MNVKTELSKWVDYTGSRQECFQTTGWGLKFEPTEIISCLQVSVLADYIKWDLEA